MHLVVNISYFLPSITSFSLRILSFHTNTCAKLAILLSILYSCAIAKYSQEIQYNPSLRTSATLQRMPTTTEDDKPKEGIIMQAVMRGIVIYLFMTTIKNISTTPAKSPNHSSAPDKPMNRNTNAGSIPNRQIKPNCIWEPNDVMDLHVFISDTNASDCFSLMGDTDKNILSEWHEEDLILGATNSSINKRDANITVPIPRTVQWNQTHLFAHMCLGLKENSNNENESELERRSILQKTFALTRHKKRKRIRDEKSLLDNKPQQESVSDRNNDELNRNVSPLTIASANKTIDATLLYLLPSLTLQLVDMTRLPQFPSKNSIPMAMKAHMNWDETNPIMYYPIIYQSEFWIMKDDMIEVNDTIAKVVMQFHFEDIQVWKWQLTSQMEETWRKQEEMGEDSGSDMFRTMLMETNPILLGITAIISVLHTVFDFLAFSNDIKFFKNKKSMEGLSMRSMVVNTFFQLVILLYLMDNDTSYMVLISNAVGVAIEIWKISKAVQVSLFDEKGKLVLSLTETDTYKSSKTKEYDEIATDHLIFVTLPLLVGYSIYSLVHRKHKSWYSWVLSSLTGAIYMFGFINMTPQLFINYKLKSVAHLNWKTMTYKSINTFIDDLFAFVIKMPIMHRLACLRDDVIFFIFLYQRYIYKTDYTRINEFGQCEEPTKEVLDATGVNQENDMYAQSDENLSTRRRGARDKMKLK